MIKKQKILDENQFCKMSEIHRVRPAQISVPEERFEYLTKTYKPKESDEWVMFHHPGDYSAKIPGHFMIYHTASRNCIFDSSYLFLRNVNDPQREKNPIVAVLFEIMINKDPSVAPDIKDEFRLLADLIMEKL